jgi:hypothetical protein
MYLENKKIFDSIYFVRQVFATVVANNLPILVPDY